MNKTRGKRSRRAENRADELRAALEKSGGDRRRMADLMGISLSYLCKLALRLKIQLPDGRTAPRPRRRAIIRLARAVNCIDEILDGPEGGRSISEFVDAAKELTTTLRLAARLGAIPGWPGEKEGK